MAASEKYLRPEVIRQVSRLDLRAKFIVQGFLAGLHASPYHGFSVEFSEHRKYVPGDDLKDPVGLVTFDTRIQTCLPPRSKRTQLGTILGVLAALRPAGQTEIAPCLHQLATMIRS